MRLQFNTTTLGGLALGGALTAFAITTPISASAQETASGETGVSEVEVSVDTDKITDPVAARLWVDAASDLHDAIMAEVLDQADEDGVKIAVDIDEIALSDSYAQALGLGEAKLAGRVNIYSDSDNSKFDTYDLSVGFDSSYLPADTDMTKVTIDSPAYYNAMIALFADHVVDKI